jgi:hypothetical protein
MKIEDATLKDLVFSLLLTLFFGGAAILVGFVQQRGLGLHWVIFITILGVGRISLAIYHKVRRPRG